MIGGGGAIGEERVSASAWAKSARQALLLATQALAVNEAAAREAREERDAMRGEIMWFAARIADPFCAPALVATATGAVRAGAAGGSAVDGGGVDGGSAASAERARGALLLVTQELGVGAAAVRRAREERAAASRDLARTLNEFARITELAEHSLLERAASCGKEWALRHALARPADVHAHGFGGFTALMHAARRGHAACVRLLLEAGADTERVAHYGGGTALMYAARRGHAACVRLLLGAGADTERVEREGGATALMCAAKRGHDACVRLLLLAGADARRADSAGRDALALARLGGHGGCVRELVFGLFFFG